VVVRRGKTLHLVSAENGKEEMVHGGFFPRWGDASAKRKQQQEFGTEGHLQFATKKRRAKPPGVFSILEKVYFT
jgi:hypothetical protein